MEVTLPERTRTLLRIRAAAVTLLLSTFFAYIGFNYTFYAYFAAALADLICAFLLFFYFPRFTNGVFLFVSKKGVYARYGVFIKTERVMPDLRLICCETRQTFLSKRMKLCAVRFTGAGVKISLPEIAVADAARILELCRMKAGENADEG